MTTKRSPFFIACLGNLFEHYDTALFGLLSPFLAPLIFPHKDPLTALLMTYAIIPLGMLARPIGALFFGRIGDVYGRRQALFWSLAGMALLSGCFALLPTYSQVGIIAPLSFLLCRAMQNFFSAGETMGGAIFVLENTPEKKQDLMSALYSSSTMGGHLLASVGVFLLSHFEKINPAWRLLYVFGCITAIFGCFIRRGAPTEFSIRPRTNLKAVILSYRKPFLLIAINAGFASAIYHIALVLMNGFVPLVTSWTKTEMMKMNTCLLVFDFCLLPLFGWVASKITRERLMLITSLAVILFSIPLLMMLEGATLFQVILARTCFVIFGVAFFAPFHAWAKQLIPKEHRYTVISLAYALGYQILGSPTAAISLWVFQKTGLVSSIAWYWILLAATTLFLNLNWRKTHEPRFQSNPQ